VCLISVGVGEVCSVSPQGDLPLDACSMSNWHCRLATQLNVTQSLPNAYQAFVSVEIRLHATHKRNSSNHSSGQSHLWSQSKHARATATDQHCVQEANRLLRLTRPCVFRVTFPVSEKFAVETKLRTCSSDLHSVLIQLTFKLLKQAGSQEKVTSYTCALVRMQCINTS